MNCRQAAMAIPLALAATACDSGATTTAEMQVAAIEKARQEFNLPAGTPLDAEVWAGKEWDGNLVLCGTVSGDGARMRPQRFAAASTDPLQWIIFEDAHNPLQDTGGDKVPDWVNLCAMSQSG